MWARAISSLLACGVIVVVAPSCNAVLGNEEGRLLKDAGGTDAASGCAKGQKECGGACVDILNPAFGCTSDKCLACDLKKTLEYKCAGTADPSQLECGVQACFDRYFNCNNGNPDGCESDLRKVDNCGACGNECKAPDYCDSYTQQIGCVKVCPPNSTTCDPTPDDPKRRQCVDTQNDIANCGACGRECPAPAGTIPTCNAGQCGFRCDTARGYHDCGGRCVQDSVDSCGANCTPCRPASDANHAVQCNSGQCVESCIHPLCNGQCVPPSECKSVCGQNPIDCGSGKCDTDICTSTNACGGCNTACNQPPSPGMMPSCAPPSAGNPNCHCLYACPANTSSCPTGCVSLDADPNCGGCGIDCSMRPHEQCSTTVPRGCQCQNGWADCNGLPSDGCEVPTTSFNTSGPNAHCGGCNKFCANCVNGTCPPPDAGTGEGGTVLDSGLKDGGLTADGAT